MSYRKLGLGVVVAVIGMMTSAASAQGALGVLINGKPALHATIGAEQVGASYILIAALNLEISCQKFSVQEGLATSADASGKLLLEECAPFTSNLVPITTCKIVTSAIDKSAHIRATALILPAEILTTNAPAFLAEKLKAIILAHGEECTLPESNAVTGEICLAIDSNNTVKPLVLASSTIQGTCKPRNVLEGAEQSSGGVKDVVKYGAQTATLDATAHLFLVGEHAGMTLGVSLF